MTHQICLGLCHLDLTGCATLGNRSCNQVFARVMGFSYNCGGILIHSPLQYCFNSAMLERFQQRTTF